MTRIYPFLRIIVALLISLPAFAGREQVLLSRCGKTGFQPIVSVASPGVSMSIQDQWFPYMVAHPFNTNDPLRWDEVFRVKKAETKVMLRYDDSRHHAAAQPWAIQVIYDITTYDSLNALLTRTNESVFISYDPNEGTSYTDQCMRVYTDAHKAVLGIRQVKYWANGDVSQTPVATIPSDLMDVYLDLENDVERYYNIPATAPTLYKYDDGSESVTTLGWNYILGAESYDLEWLFLDAGTQALNTSFAYDWKNATRVNVPAQHYAIELAFPRGIILFRVRPVGVDFRTYAATGNLVRAEGTWSYNIQQGNTVTDAAAIAAAFARLDLPNGREKLLNWQYAASFAEDGKKSESISFFDGALYSRQGLTRMNTDTNLIVAETRYDYEGRPALGFLPTPVKPDATHPDVLRYQSNFNPNFDRNNFDLDTKLNNPDPLDTTATATGKYYSGSNLRTDRGTPYVATTNGYAYSQTRYKNDGTNRPQSVSGPGEAFRQGGGLETKYFYGTPSGQVELDRLFGNEVGFVSHYQKNMVLDANGQVAVSYLDQEGRVVATALAGDVPQNLLPIDYTTYTGVNLTADLLGSNTLNQSNEMISFSTITVTGSSNYAFVYSLGGDTACGRPCYPVCETCRYDLEIRVENEDGTPAMNAITALNIPAGNYAFNLPLTVGVYRVTKIVRMNAAYVQTVRANFIAAQGAANSCVPNISATAEPCALDCHEACEQLYKRPDGNNGFLYFDANGDPMSGPNAASDAQTLIAACQHQLCEQPPIPDPCALRLQNMTLDMGPGGQYFDNLPQKFSVQANGDQTPNPAYDQNAWLNAHPQSAAMLTALDNLSSASLTNWNAVRANWDPTWAAILVTYHPEHCTWEYYCSRVCVAGQTYDQEDFHAYEQTLFYSTDGNFPNTSTTSLELFNPLGLATGTSNPPTQNNSGYQPHAIPASTAQFDPYFLCDFDICSSNPTSAKTRVAYMLQNYMPVYLSNNTQNGFYSIWYVINDPSNIHLAASAAAVGLKQETFDYFVYLHGDGTTTNPGILGTAAGQIAPIQFFAGQYNYIKQLVIAQGYLASTTVQTCQTADFGAPYGYLQPVADGRPITTSGFAIYFPENPTFALHGDGCGTPNQSTFFATLTQTVDDLLAEYDDELPEGPSQVGCSCQNLNGFITENDLSDELANNDFTTIANELNGVTEAGTITAAQVQQILSLCTLSTTVLADLTAQNFPTDLLCEPESTVVNFETVEELLQQECQQENNALAQANTNLVYGQALNAAADVWTTYYINSCLKKLQGKETFTVNYTLKEYHYTLYYYDQAGNLIKTVPPEGVKPIDLTADANSNGTPDGTDIANYRKGLAGSTYMPAVHGMTTNYKFNSLQQNTEAISPDVTTAGLVFYDALGRVVVSQNARQRDAVLYPIAAWSYILYDNLGRAFESGQLLNAIPLTDNISRGKDPNMSLAAWLANATQKQQVVRTQFDGSLAGVAAYFPNSQQENLRGRVASVYYEELDDNNATTWDNASHFSYDIHGNAQLVVQENKQLGPLAEGRKTTRYEYDLISGNVNAVHYQEGFFDEFHHKYEYDAENRLTHAYSSRNGVIWEKEAKNFYYATGGLLRQETGDKLVQGTDYAYTVMGWLKAMNAASINSTRDIGKDAYSESITGAASINRDAGLDAAGFVLGYFEGGNGHKSDYWAAAFANQVTSDRFLARVTSTATQGDFASLYNGNIAYMMTAHLDQAQGNVAEQLTAYRYDQLQRLKQVRAHRNFSSATNSFAGSTGDDGKYRENFTYDRNGNILFLQRNGNQTGATQTMDDFGYRYYDRTGAVMAYSANAMPLNATNRLAYVTDQVSNANYTTDIDNQNIGNYQYDAIGNLIADASEQIAKIEWKANGKMWKITRTAGSIKSDLEFVYDAGGNRICKIEKPRLVGGVRSQLHWVYTFYVRDGSGQVLSVYERRYATTQTANVYEERLKLVELDIYSSKRMGLVYGDTTVVKLFTDLNFTDTYNAVFVPVYNASSPPLSPCTNHCVLVYKRKLGRKVYELSNRWNSITATVSDRKIMIDTYSYTLNASGNYKFDAIRNVYYGVASGTGTHNRVLNSSDSKVDYYKPDVRNYSDYYAFGSEMDGRFGGDGYRYNFQNQEKDNELWEGAINYKYRIEDPRLGRFFSVDPLAAKYAYNSPYAFAENKLGLGTELEGAELLGGPPMFLLTVDAALKVKQDPIGAAMKVQNASRYMGGMSADGTMQAIDITTHAVTRAGSGFVNGVTWGYGDQMYGVAERTATRWGYYRFDIAHGGFYGMPYSRDESGANMGDVSFEDGMNLMSFPMMVMDIGSMLNPAMALSSSSYTSNVVKNGVGMGKSVASGASGVGLNALNGGNRAIVNLTEETFSQGLIYGPESIGSYSIYGTKGLAGDTYIRNIFYIKSAQRENLSSLIRLLGSMENEALRMGANKMSIYGCSVINGKILNPATASRFGFNFEQSGSGVFLQKTFKP